MTISSIQNPKIQWLRTLLNDRKARDEENQYVAEGVRLIEDATQSGVLPECVFYSDQLTQRGQELLDTISSKKVETTAVTANLINRISDTHTSQGLIAVYKHREHKLPDTLHFILIIDSVRDPGNLGTLLRSAAAAGVQLCLLTPTTTDGYSPKVLRSGMGAHFRMPVLDRSWEEITQICQTARPSLAIFLAESADGSPCWQQDFRQPLALVIGGEAWGPSPAGKALATKNVTIPMPGKAESLNAAVAGSILLFEIVRQRSL